MQLSVAKEINMKIEILERGYVAKDKLRGLITKKLERMEKYLSKDATAKVVCSGVKDREKMEITLKTDGLFVRSEVESDNMYANLDTCLAKIEKQIVKYSSKLADKRNSVIDINDLLFFDEMPKFIAPKITKRKEYELVPMSDKDAVEAMELLGNSFYVYKSKATGAVNIVYKRNDGDIGLIETR